MHRGRPLRQENGAPSDHSGEYCSPHARSIPSLRPDAIPVPYSSDSHLEPAKIVGHRTKSPFGRPRVRAGGFLVFAFVVFTALYLGVNVLASLIGWQGVGVVGVVLLWVTIIGWALAEARTWGGPR